LSFFLPCSPSPAADQHHHHPSNSKHPNITPLFWMARTHFVTIRHWEPLRTKIYLLLPQYQITLPHLHRKETIYFILAAESDTYTSSTYLFRTLPSIRAQSDYSACNAVPHSDSHPATTLPNYHAPHSTFSLNKPSNPGFYYHPPPPSHRQQFTHTQQQPAASISVGYPHGARILALH
jgi:hypothetical protein